MADEWNEGGPIIKYETAWFLKISKKIPLHCVNG
jgi:hypothetical protein